MSARVWVAEAKRELTKFYIDGRWVRPLSEANVQAVLDPATCKVSGYVAMGNQVDVDRAVRAARQAFPGYAATSVSERLSLLQRICSLYERRLGEIAEAITDEMGAPLESLSRTLQAPAGLGHFRVAAECLRTYQFERALGQTRIVREPIGVCALITPWNWPMNQVVCKVAPALAAGCTVVLKPSQFSSFSAQILAEILDEAEVPPGVFNMVYGEGRVLGEALATHPEIEMISLTGSTAAGAQIARLAADTIKRVTLELGGKSANIILREAPLERAVEHGVRLMMSNSGQNCTAPSRMLVPRESLETVRSIAAGVCDSLVVGHPRDVGVQIGPVAHARQFRRVNELLAQAIEGGAKLIAGAEGRPADLPDGYFVSPAVVEATHDMPVSREEIFGPVLVVTPYDQEEEAIRLANDSDFGLSGYVYGPTVARARSVARKLRTGMVHLNGADVDFLAPFGGYKRSGNGREWGAFGLEEFLEVKAIMGSEV